MLVDGLMLWLRLAQGAEKSATQAMKKVPLVVLGL